MPISKLDKEASRSPSSKAWEQVIKKHLASRKKMHVMSYQDISNRLQAYEINQSPENLSAKFNMGKLSASAFVACLLAMGETEISLSELETLFHTL